MFRGPTIAVQNHNQSTKQNSSLILLVAKSSKCKLLMQGISDNRQDPITVKKLGDMDYMVKTDGKLETPNANLLKNDVERYKK